MFKPCDRLLVRIFAFIVSVVFILVIFIAFIIFIIPADFNLDFIFVVVIIDDVLWRFRGVRVIRRLGGIAPYEYAQTEKNGEGKDK